MSNKLSIHAHHNGMVKVDEKIPFLFKKWADVVLIIFKKWAFTVC